MRSLLRPRHLTWILPVAIVAIACGSSTTKSPTAASSVNVNSGSAPGTTPAPTPTSSTGSTSSPGTGTVTVTIKDSPFSDATALLVTFSEVSVHMSGSDTTDGEWVTLSFADKATTRTCDLKRLEAATDILGTAALTAGHYTQIRLTVSSAMIYSGFKTPTTAAPCVADPVASWGLLTTDVGMSVNVPSGTLKLNREFDVPAAGATTILVDFDGDKSVHQTGNGKFLMTPVIGVVSVQ